MRYYSITITNSIVNSGAATGFVDNQTIQGYYSATPYALETTPTGLTLALSQAKRRGNVRYAEIIRQIELVSNVWIDPKSITASGGTALLEPTNFGFHLIGLRGDAAFVTADESVPGASLTSTACIQRCIARALIADMLREIDVFDPTATISLGTYGSTTSVPRFGTRINVASSFEIGAYASSLAAATAVIAVSILF